MEVIGIPVKCEIGVFIERPETKCTPHAICMLSEYVCLLGLILILSVFIARSELLLYVIVLVAIFH